MILQELVGRPGLTVSESLPGIKMTIKDDSMHRSRRFEENMLFRIPHVTKQRSGFLRTDEGASLKHEVPNEELPARTGLFLVMECLQNSKFLV